MPADYPIPWTVFSHLQETKEPSSADEALAREEALDQVLDEIVISPSLSGEHISKRFRSLLLNRRSKYCYRRHLDRNRARPDRRRGGQYWGGSPLQISPDVFEEIARTELVLLVRTAMLEEEFRLLWEIAEGVSYSDAARTRGISVACLKARIFRTRAQVRLSAVGQALRAALE
jgi:hypothetical protein